MKGREGKGSGGVGDRRSLRQTWKASGAYSSVALKCSRASPSINHHVYSSRYLLPTCSVSTSHNVDSRRQPCRIAVSVLDAGNKPHPNHMAISTDGSRKKYQSRLLHCAREERAEGPLGLQVDPTHPRQLLAFRQLPAMPPSRP